MHAITIHGLDEALASLLKARARADGTSVNQVVKRLLEQALGIKVSTGKHRKDFEKFSGTWTKAQAAEFEKGTRQFEKVDREDWE
ncbi:MAG: FitA-like ribbon-helix-helix domain-containing protein [Myxococcaceae bacterium]